MDRTNTSETSPPRGTRRRSRGRMLAALAFAGLAASLTLTACPEKKGPAEKAGEAVDDAADGVKDALTPDGPAEDLGEKLDDATK